MKFSTTVLPLLCATLASSRFLVTPRSTTQQVVALDSGESVPGNNPLTYCEDPSNYPVKVSYVNLDPNPPTAGSKLTITASGNFSEEVVKGAVASVEVSWGLITLLKKDLDLCENLEKIDVKCPLKKGPLTISKSVNIPGFVPPGTYNAKANVVDKDGKELICMNAEVTFGL